MTGTCSHDMQTLAAVCRHWNAGCRPHHARQRLTDAFLYFYQNVAEGVPKISLDLNVKSVSSQQQADVCKLVRLVWRCWRFACLRVGIPFLWKAPERK